MSAQLKMFIDRFYSFTMELSVKKMKMALTTTSNGISAGTLSKTLPLYGLLKSGNEFGNGLRFTGYDTE